MRDSHPITFVIRQLPDCQPTPETCTIIGAWLLKPRDETLYELVTRIMARYWPAHQSASTKARRPVKLSEEITARTA